MEQSNSNQPHEKIMTLLHKNYNQALIALKQGLLAEGRQQLISILQHPQINDSDMENLKYSILMSLGEVFKAEGDTMTALGFLWQALQILEQGRASAHKAQSTIKHQSGQRTQEEFTLLLKMILIVQNLNLPEQHIYLLKKAIKLSPLLWREKLILKLRETYEKQGYHEALKDLIYQTENKDKIQQVLNERVESKHLPNDLKSLLQRDEPQPCIQKIHFTINLTQKQQLLLKYTNWETLLTITYVLLKCQSKRNFNKKKYLHRKYDQNNKQWNEFLKKFSLTKTKISISFVRSQQEGQNIEEEPKKQPNDSKLVTDLAFELLKARHLKKKTIKKALNPLQELSRIPSVSLKDQKKNLAAQTKSVYPSIYHYFRDLMAKNHFKKELLDDLKILNEQHYNLIIGEIIKNEAQVMKPQGQENDEQDFEGSLSVGPGISEGQKDGREKKTLKAKKKDLIQYQKQLNSFIAQFFDRENSQEPVVFNNVCEMIEQITAKMLDEPEKCKGKIALSTNVSIRRILEKNILKVMQVGDGFFQQLNTIQFLDLLMQKLQQLIDKDAKSVPFKAYQERKKDLLIQTIKDRFVPNPYKLQYLLSSDLSEEQLRKLAHNCLFLVKLHCLYGNDYPEEAAFYRDLFIIFKSRQDLKTQRLTKADNLEKKITIYIDRQIQKFHKKIATRSSLLAINQEKQQQVNSVDELYKKDREISAMLPLLKIFKCHPQQLKIKPSEAPEQISSNIYLQNFVHLAQLFFKKIQLQSKKQFNCRILTLLSEMMRLKQIVTFLYQKTTDGVTFKVAPSEINKVAYTQALFYLLRLHFLNLIEDNEYCLKMSFFLANALMKSQPQQLKYTLIPKYICLFDELIKYKKNKPEHNYSLRKRFYHNFILKNLAYIYNSPLFAAQREEAKGSRPKKLNRPRSSSEQAPNIVQVVKEPLQSEDIKDKVFDILHDVYFTSEKEREFNPKKIEEAVGYFMYLLRAYHQIFTDRVIELQYQALKMFKKCYKIYIEKREQVYRFCQKFKDFSKQFNLLMNGQDNKVNKEELISIIRQDKPICDCCTKLTKTHYFYVESLFVLGKFFQAQFAQPQLASNKQAWLEDIDKDQAYYFQYLALNLAKQSAWQNIIRVNASKTFFYFDSLVNEPFDRYKNKFFLTKKLILFLGEVCPHFTELQRYGSANIQILNILKIKEREYLMIQKQVETMGLATRQSRELQKKYVEGMKRVYGSTVSQFSKDVRVRYLRLSELRYKLTWSSLTKQKNQDRFQQASVVIQLDQESNESKILHPASKNVQQLTQCIKQAKNIIQDIYTSVESKQLLHLQEDIVTELYVVLGRHLEWKLKQILQHLCQSIGMPYADRNKHIKEAEFYISDLNHTLQLFKGSDFVTNNQKYQLQHDKLQITQQDYQTLQSSLSNIFLQQPAKQQKEEEEIKSQKQLEDNPIIGYQDMEEGNPDLNKSKMSEQSVGKQSKRSNSRSSQKQSKTTKNLIINMGKYIKQTLSHYIINKHLFTAPLNHLQALLTNPFFQDIILKMTKVLTEISRVMMQLPRYQIKKYKNRRSVVMSLLYCSHLAIMYTSTPQRANEIIKDYYSFKHDQFTTVNLYNDKINAQRNELLADFYNRTIVHQIMRIQFIRQIFNIFAAIGHKDYLVLLTKKLLKLTRSNQAKAEKQKAIKHQKETSMEIEGGENKKEAKEKIPKDKQLKQNKPKDLESITYGALFCEATLKLMEMLKNESESHEVDEKYEKNMLEFRNKIRRLVNDDKNPYYCQIDSFINIYQNRYEKKIKLKKTKKDKQVPQISIAKQDQPLKKFEFPIQFLGAPQLVLSRAEQRQEKSPSIKSQSSRKSPIQGKVKAVVAKQKRTIQKKERVPRVKKNQITKRSKLTSKVAGNKQQPIQIKESPQKEEVEILEKSPPPQGTLPKEKSIEITETILNPSLTHRNQSVDKKPVLQKNKTNTKKNLQNIKDQAKEQKKQKRGEQKMKEEEREAKDQPSRLSRRISERKAQSLDKDKMGK